MLFCFTVYCETKLVTLFHNSLYRLGCYSVSQWVGGGVATLLHCGGGDTLLHCGGGCYFVTHWTGGDFVTQCVGLWMLICYTVGGGVTFCVFCRDTLSIKQEELRGEK